MTQLKTLALSGVLILGVAGSAAAGNSNNPSAGNDQSNIGKYTDSAPAAGGTSGYRNDPNDGTSGIPTNSNHHKKHMKHKRSHDRMPDTETPARVTSGAEGEGSGLNPDASGAGH